MLARVVRVSIFLLLLVVQSACSLIPAPFNALAEIATATPSASGQTAPTAVSQTPPQNPTTPALTSTPAAKQPTVVEYNLGEAFITQSGYAEDHPFYELPLRLDGLIGVPAGEGPHPLLLILHGDHLSCAPDSETNEPRWPCAREKEQLNYQGFEYLVRELAAQGYVTLAINGNAAFTKGFGEGQSAERLSQIIDLHLGKAIAAGGGGENQFGVDLYGRIDPLRVVWIAHSSAAELASRIIRDRGLHEAVGAAFSGYGPVLGLVLAAPTLERPDSLPPAALPLAVILPACDGRVVDLAGQAYYEALRGQSQDRATTVSVLLDAANHNQFNEIIPPDMFPAAERRHCRLENLLSPQEQQAFLASYAASFAAAAAGEPQEAMLAAVELGLDPAAPLPSPLFERKVLSAVSVPSPDETLLLRPSGAGELARNLAGGDLLPENVDLVFCPPGTAVHEVDSSLAICHRLGANHPANPAQLLISWEQPPAALRFTLPENGIDISSHAAVQLSAALDPLSLLNQPGRDTTLTVSLTDTQGRTASVDIPAGEPALAYPAGDLLPGENGRAAIFDGHVQMGTLRIPLETFAGVDLAAVSDVTLHFDRAQPGALFIADLGFVRPRRYPGSYSSLLANDGTLDRLRSIGRFQGSASCTAALIDNGVPQAPAVVLTNGHCAQQWSANDVNLDLPAVSMQMVFNYFANTRQVQIAIPAARVLYSTMKGRDVALIELVATQDELQKRDIIPFKVAAQPPAESGVTVIGAPAAELPSDAAYLRRETCAVGGRANLMEHKWQFNDAYQLDCRDIYGGSSGSPVFAEGADEIFALINTTTTGGRSPCSLNAPCEITQSGVYFSQETSYATPVDGIGNCFDEDGRFDLVLPDCPLDDGRQLAISGTPQSAIRPYTATQDGTEAPASWNAHLSGDLAYYRYKTGPLGAVDCRVDRDYSAVLPLAERPLIDDPLPETEGYHVLCLLAGPGPDVDAEWQQPLFATTARIEIDATPPVATPALTLSSAGEDLLVEPAYDPPEVAAVEYKLGPIAATDCGDPQGYAAFGARPLTIPSADLPAMLCLIARDAAGNAGPPHRQLVDSER